MKKNAQKKGDTINEKNSVVQPNLQSEINGIETSQNLSQDNSNLSNSDENTQQNAQDNESKPKKKLSRSNYAMLTTHAINNIAGVFVSTFLVSYIYKISTNYVFNIGLFYAMTYLVMGVFYYFASMIVDRTNRVVVYKVALIIRGIFMLSVVFLGENLASYVALAGAINGFSEACYWSSYNVMKNELVSSSIVKNYSTLQHTVEKLVSIVVPIVLGKLIDANSFKLAAIIVLIVVFFQILISFLIKSNKPENSSFNMREFIHDIKGLDERKKPLKLLIFASLVYGCITVISPLNTLLIMLSFDSNFSLGILTSLFSLGAMILIIILNRITQPGTHTFINIISAVLCPLSTYLVIFYTTSITIIIYSMVFTILAVVHAHYFDVYRNIILKKYGLYHDIAEYQCTIELMLEIARVVIFSVLTLAGLIGEIYGATGLIIAIKCVLGVSIFAVTILNIMLLVVEKKLVDCGILEYKTPKKIKGN